MKIITVLGARPQFIKAAAVSRAIACHNGPKSSLQGAISEIVIHTGQHFDANMSDVFFAELGMAKPAYNLDINGGGHGEMTGRMLIEIEKALLAEKPDFVLVYGDTNSTLAGALAAAKLHIPVAHVEAGLRSFNMEMPEEINRILTDRISDILFCPTETAVKNLINEGFEDPRAPSLEPLASRPLPRVYNVGDVMQDSALMFAEHAAPPQGFTSENGFVLATLHRAENTDDPQRLASIVGALNHIHHHIAPVVLPLHPRTRNVIVKLGLMLDVTLIDPVGYFEMLWLLKHCCLVCTDSGGVQKEAFFFSKACVTMRDQTEWVELVEVGANVLVGADQQQIIAAVQKHHGRIVEDKHQMYGGGKAAKKVVELLVMKNE